jgi:SAM-dependent methyltransferase
MSSQYDGFARTYSQAGALDTRRYVDSFSLFKVLGDIEGRSILDVGCGTGIVTRQLKQGGASRVVGLDIAEGMLAAARAEEAKSPLGIEYVLGDIVGAGALGPFDIVTASYVLPHASSPAVLFTMCEGIFEALGQGGRLVAIQPSDTFATDDPDYYAPYGLRIEVEGGIQDGSPMKVSVSRGEIKFTIAAHYWTRSGYEAALKRAGFEGIEWRPAEISPEGMSTCGEAFWSAYLARPYAMLLACTKGSARG